MPLSSEVLRNKPLSGRELLEVIVNDTRALLEKDGLFAQHVGFGRVAYKIQVTLEMDNLTYPRHTAQTFSQPRPADPAVTRFPLADPAPDVEVIDVAREREVVSPNAARIENDLGVPVTSVVEGHSTTNLIKYPKDAAPPQPAPRDSDASRAAFEDIRRRFPGLTGGKQRSKA